MTGRPWHKVSLRSQKCRNFWNNLLILTAEIVGHLTSIFQSKVCLSLYMVRISTPAVVSAIVPSSAKNKDGYE